jgi:hypothetical protein
MTDQAEPSGTTASPPTSPAVPATPDIPTYWLPAGGPRPDRPRRRFGRVVWLAGIGAAVVASLGIKVLVGLLAGSVATTAFGAFFGGPWDHLPSDVRSDYEARLQAAVGDQIKGLPEAQAADRIQAMVRQGLTRVDSQALVRHLTLEVAALDATDVATCAAFGRASISGQTQKADVGQRLVSALDAESYQEYVGINIAGVEAEARQSPPVRPVDPSGDAILGRLLAGLPSAQLATLQAMATSSAATSDAAACAVIRSVYDAVVRLSPADLAIVARVDVGP